MENINPSFIFFQSTPQKKLIDFDTINCNEQKQKWYHLSKIVDKGQEVINNVYSPAVGYVALGLS